MIDLKNCTFIIPVRIESEDRMRNVITVLCYLLKTFDTKVIVKEVDVESVFQEAVLPQIREYLGDSLNNLTHVFEKSDDPVFYRMKILNEMIAMCDTEIVVNYDGDVLLKPETCLKAVEAINDGCEMVYPYGFGEYQKQVFADDEDVSEFISEDFDFSILDKKSRMYDAQYGHVQFIKRWAYFAVGLENENFRAYAPEDKERYFRFTTLGYKVGRVNDVVYHLEHARGENSWFSNPHMQGNMNEWDKISKMDKKELLEYYSEQDYLRKYVSV